jgi:hypothetical protein
MLFGLVCQYVFGTDCCQYLFEFYKTGGRRGHDCMVVGFTTTYAISAYYH